MKGEGSLKGYISLFITNILLSICLRFSEILAVSQYGYIFDIGSIILIIFIIIEIIVIIVTSLKKKNSVFALSKCIFILITIIIIMSNIIYIYNLNNVTTVSGYYVDVQKMEENGEYYIIVDNNKIRCSVQQYKNIDEQHDYCLEYEKNVKSGSLILINILEEI